jgi:hydroxymethylglutaryl-CoA synthase
MPILAGIAAAGAFVPQLRLSHTTIDSATGWTAAPARTASSGRRSICNWDEDPITLAVEAGRSLDAGALKHPPAVVTLASTTLPFSDRSNATLLAEALGLPETVETVDCCGSLRAGTGALSTAAHRRNGTSLVIASEARLAKPGSPQEPVYGHGAAALLVVPTAEIQRENDLLAAVLSTSHRSSDFVDHYRMAGEDFDYGLEERWVRDEGYGKLIPGVIASALQSASVDQTAVRHLIFPRGASVAQRVARSCGLTGATVTDGLWETCGDTGTTHPLLMLAGVLESAGPDEVIVLIGFGQGVDAIVIRTLPGVSRRASTPLAAALARGVEEPSYVRYLSHAGLVDIDFGMRAERDNRTAHTVAYRKRRAVTGFIGGRCEACETVQFPRSRVCVNPDCRSTDTQTEYRLADSTGRIKSFTEDWQAYSPRPPLIYGNVEFAEGGNLLMEMSDVTPGQLVAGAKVRFAFRIKDRDTLRGYRRYFWKAVPLQG